MRGWRYVLTYGYSLDIYSRGNKRKGIDRNTGRVVIEYAMSRR